MLSKNELEMIHSDLLKAKDIVFNHNNLTQKELGEEDGFEHLADGICNHIYVAFSELEDAIFGIEEMIEDME